MAHIAGFGKYLPKLALSNETLAAEFGVTTDWILQACGIENRRVAQDHETVAEMALQAGLSALDKSGIAATELGALIVATGTPERQFPGVSATVQRKLGAIGIPAFDIHLPSVGGMFALAIADEMCENYGAILTIASERMTEVVSRLPRVRETAILFGDGAGAMVLCPGSGDLNLIESRIYSDPTFEDDLVLPFHGPLRMNGRTVILQAHRKLTQCIHELLERHRLQTKDVKLWIFHQANAVLLQKIAETLAIPRANVVLNVKGYGNMSSASLFVAACEAFENQRVSKGYAVLAAFGAGMSWGTALVDIHSSEALDP